MQAKAARAKKAPRARRSVLSVSEVAQAFGLSEWAIYKAIGNGNIPSVKVGGRVLIPLRTARERWPGVFDGDLSEVLVEPEAAGR